MFHFSQKQLWSIRRIILTVDYESPSLDHTTDLKMVDRVFYGEVLRNHVSQYTEALNCYLTGSEPVFGWAGVSKAYANVISSLRICESL